MIQHLKEFQADIAISAGFAALCGALAYGVRKQEGRPFNVVDFFLQVSISAICGAISFILLHDVAGYTPSVCGSLSGIAGWMGTRLLKLLETYLSKRLGGEE